MAMERAKPVFVNVRWAVSPYEQDAFSERKLMGLVLSSSFYGDR